MRCGVWIGVRGGGGQVFDCFDLDSHSISTCFPVLDADVMDRPAFVPDPSSVPLKAPAMGGLLTPRARRPRTA